MFGDANVPISRKIFDKHDTDKSGSISPEELKAMCHELGHHLSDEEFALALAKLDTNDDHKIGYDEFKAWWSAGEARWRQTEHTEEEMAKLAQATAYFDYFDKDKSGHISAEEFQLLHADLLKNGMLQETDARSSFEAMDKTGEGGIDFNEYVDWLHEKGVF